MTASAAGSGTRAILTDGFFSRLGRFRRAVEKIRPDEGRIDDCLKRGGIERLDAVVVLHSHYDHVLDAPLFARRTGALLVGSPSTLNVGRGYGLAGEEMQVVGREEERGLTFGGSSSRCCPRSTAASRYSAPSASNTSCSILLAWVRADPLAGTPGA